VTTEHYWSEALERSRTALESGALVPLSTEVLQISTVTQWPFELRQLCGLPPRHLRPEGPKPNPFLPWDQRLEVGSIGDDHILILNKYPVQEGHMLLITRKWAAQDGWLELADWAALARVDRDTSGLWFYNSGPAAGASQPHRHMQLLPRHPQATICPRMDWFKQRLDDSGTASRNLLERSCAVKARSASGERPDQQALLEDYLELADRLNLGDPLRDQRPLDAYNMLLTRHWMALIRRRREGTLGFSINGLGFAGYLLSTRNSDLDWLTAHGPEALLEEVV